LEVIFGTIALGMPLADLNRDQGMTRRKPFMNTLTKFVLAAVLGLALLSLSTQVQSAAPPDSTKAEARYEGPWATTNRKLNGTMNCLVKPLSDGHWQGRFWGTWEHVPLDYTVEFSRDDQAPSEATRVVSVDVKAPRNSESVTGKATIDGAHYDWNGILGPDQFMIQFTGSRYEGHLELKRVLEQASATGAR
jgi:hypothetical protein